MNLDQLIDVTPSWLSAEGELPELVISSRARVARNLAGRRFPRRAEKQEKSEILEEIRSALLSGPFPRAEFVDVSSMDELDRSFLIERHLATPELLSDGPGSGVVIAAGERTSAMINEEDHLRIQVLAPGFALEQVLEELMQLDERVGRVLDYAYSDRFGFLTSCPTNVGTGLRLSVLLHLPATMYTRQVEALLKNLAKVRVVVRGLYGEGSNVQGNIFQLSTRVCLGVSEKDVLKSFEEVVQITLDFERKAREALSKGKRHLLEDKIYRSLALLQNARLLSFKEAAEYSSAVRLGVGLGLLLDIRVKTLNELLLYSQPAHVQKLFGKQMDSLERDEKRASYVRTKLKAG